MKPEEKTRLVIALMFLMVSAMSPQLFAFEKGEHYFTKVNIWYETPERVYSTNYHKGNLLPVGAEVEMIKPKGKKIQFRDVATGTKFYLHHIKKYTQISTEELLNRYFSKESVLESEQYAAFKPMEKDAISKGRLEKGMSKEAVIMAYGYPPTHYTSSLENAVWTYWRSRLVSFQIQFKGNLLAAVN